MTIRGIAARPERNSQGLWIDDSGDEQEDGVADEIARARLWNCHEWEERPRHPPRDDGDEHGAMH